MEFVVYVLADHKFPSIKVAQVQSKGTKPPAQIHLGVCHGVLCK